ncbi:DUF2264 domain-containing protein [Streptosporangium sp. NPDC023615]|uniref:DUF2264 domain-containing protein n=1 Tax=Streptosporangium sp. NPDC023615 TaxID=3154794 RepID=UPI003442490A
MRLPPDDRVASPRTGYTREHWLAAADGLLEAVVPYAVPGFAQIRLPGRQSWAGPESDGLEGFARTFLLAAFRGDGAVLERYAEGLASGTDPASPYAWPALADNSQQIVEAASIALALHESGLYDTLAPDVRRRLAGWLGGIVGTRTWPCNWVLFKVVIQQFLANVGAPHDPAEIAEALEQVEGWYVGDGWYTDGDGQNYDYYCGWAMHLYTLWWTRMSGAPADVYRDRLRLFLEGYARMFAADGAPVHQGRSLTYRFAAAAPLWLGELFDATPLSPGTTRRLASGTLRHFLDRGAVGEDGLLSLGWHGPFLPVTQPYSGPASPYWASKGFIGLLLPAGHAVWTATEEPAPVETADRVTALPAPGWLLHSTRRDGIVRLLNHGSDHNAPPPAEAVDDPHYARLAYSTHTAPVAAGDGGGWDAGEQVTFDDHMGFDDREALDDHVAPDDHDPFGDREPLDDHEVSDRHVPPDARPLLDNHLAVVAPDGTASRRRRVERIGVADRFAASRYTDDTLPGGKVVVESASVVHGPAEIRVHRVTAPAGHTVRDAGYAVPRGGPESSITPLYGWEREGTSCSPGGTAFGPETRTPYLEAVHPGGSALFASLVTLGAPAALYGPASSGDPAALGGPASSGAPAVLGGGRPGTTLDLRVRGDGVEIALPGGERVEVALGDRPRYRRRGPDGDVVTWEAG